MQPGVIWSKVMSDETPPHIGHYWYESWDSNDYLLKRCHYCPAVWWPNRVMPPVLCSGNK